MHNQFSSQVITSSEFRSPTSFLATSPQGHDGTDTEHVLDRHFRSPSDSQLHCSAFMHTDTSFTSSRIRDSDFDYYPDSLHIPEKSDYSVGENGLGYNRPPSRLGSRDTSDDDDDTQFEEQRDYETPLETPMYAELILFVLFSFFKHIYIHTGPNPRMVILTARGILIPWKSS